VAAPAVLAVLVPAVAACGQLAERQDAAAAVVQRLAAAVGAGDGAAACGLLAPETRAQLEESAGKACPQAIGEEHLPAAGAVRTVDVYGEWGRVVTSDDTLFVAAFDGGWRVVAAGCRSRGEDRPYDCVLRGS
jgi:hypothetical protein